jgi:hypothetical protein
MAEEARAALSGLRLGSASLASFRFAVALLALTFACLAGAAPPKKSLTWNELTPEQQQTLQPLAGEWNTLDPARRSKWIGIANRYPSMNATEQQRVQTRMSDWVKLTPDQRRVAREQYRKIGKLPPEKREVVTQQWEEYQQLPPDVKKNLAAETKKKTDKLEPRNRPKTAEAKKPPVPEVPPQVPGPASSTVIPTRN